MIVSLVPVRFFQESEYVSKVLNADRMKHPLLQSLPCVGGDGVPYDVTVEDIKELRLAIFRSELNGCTRNPTQLIASPATAMMRNLAALIRRKTQTDRDKQIIAAGMAGLIGALAAMKQNCEVKSAPKSKSQSIDPLHVPRHWTSVHFAGCDDIAYTRR